MILTELGCFFLVKPSEETPASPAALLQAFVDAGIPPSNVGLMFGDPRPGRDLELLDRPLGHTQGDVYWL